MVIQNIQSFLLSNSRTGNNIIDMIIGGFILSIISYISKYLMELINNFKINDLINCLYLSRKITSELTFKINHNQNINYLDQIIKSHSVNALLVHINSIISEIKEIKKLEEIYDLQTHYYKLSLKNPELSQSVYFINQNEPFRLTKSIYCQFINEFKTDHNNKKIKVITIKIFSYTRNTAYLKDYVNKILSNYHENINKDKIHQCIYTYNKYDINNTINTKDVNTHKIYYPKTFNNIFFERKTQYLKILDHFKNNKEWFIEKGIPYTLGILLKGPPGTGKSSFIQALSDYFKRNILIIPLSITRNNNQLQEAWNTSKYIGCDINQVIIVMEDIDCNGSNIFKKRNYYSNINDNDDNDDYDNLEDSDDHNNSDNNDNNDNNNYNDICDNNMKKKKKYIKNNNLNKSDFLNLIQGINNYHGRIMVLTTNCYSEIDPAFIRPGRIDLIIDLEKCSLNIFIEMLEHFYKTDLKTIDLTWFPEYYYTPAEITNFCMMNPKDYHKTLEYIRNNTESIRKV